MTRLCKGWIAVVIVGLVACATKPIPVDPSTPSPKKAVAVAVMEFEDYSPMTSDVTTSLGYTVVDRMIEAVLQQPDLRLIDRQSLQKILEELSLGSREIVDSDTRLRLGRLIGANVFVMGGYTVFRERIRIDARVVEVETGLAKGASVEGVLADRDSIEEGLVRKVVLLLGEK
jgi:TolB-like protein